MINYAFPSSLSISEIADIRESFCSETKIYTKGDIIMQSGGQQDEVFALLEKGTALLIKIDADGHRNIMDYYESGEIFGRIFFPLSNNDITYIFAKEKCTVSFINYERFSAAFAKNSDIIERIFLTAFGKTQTHINILSKRSIRAKLTSYFEYMRLKKNGNKFILPLSLSDLADYIAADRSAMSRELKKMNEEGVIESAGNVVILKKDEYGEF